MVRPVRDQLQRSRSTRTRDSSTVLYRLERRYRTVQPPCLSARFSANDGRASDRYMKVLAYLTLLIDESVEVQQASRVVARSL